MSNTPSLQIPILPSDTQPLRSLFTSVLQRDTLPSLSFTDPWGTAVAVGAKKLETRSWAAPERYWGQPIAIHVSGTLTAQAKAVCEQEPFYRVLEAAGYSWTPRSGFKWNLPLKQVIAFARLECVERITSTYRVDQHECIFGNYAPGRYAWIFGAVYRLKQPLAAIGHLGVWQWTPPETFWFEVQEALDALRGETVERYV